MTWIRNSLLWEYEKTLLSTNNKTSVMRSLFLIVVFSTGCLLYSSPIVAQDFEWPNGAKMAISLSFDDARPSQVQGGTALLDEYGVKGTFYVLPEAVREHLEGWKEAVVNGHEIGNHTMVHPCSGNFDWTTGRGLEEYNLEKMRAELETANSEIEQLLGIDPVSFAYTCGESFVGRGVDTQSYVPLISMLFQSGRDWRNEMMNDPNYVDLAQVRGTEMDGIEFDEIKSKLEEARAKGYWMALAGHEINEGGVQTVRYSFLRDLIAYVQDDPEVWLATDGEVAAHIKSQRGKAK